MIVLQIVGFLIFLLIWLGISPYVGWIVTCIVRASGVSFELSVLISNVAMLAVPFSILVVWIIRAIQGMIRRMQVRKSTRENPAP